MILKKIKEKEYENFVKNSDLSSFYQSIEWYHLKQKEGKKCELLGLFDNDKLIGVSLVIYVKILRKYYYAYASRGFIYDYQNILEFKNALKNYFKNSIIFVKIDPPIILAKYNKNKEKESFIESKQLIESLKYYGFIHHGYNLGFETEQFRFVHRIKLENSFDKQLELMSKSTRKNIDIASFKGVNIKTTDDLDLVYSFFEKTSERKQFKNLSKKFYKNIIDNFKDNVKMYVVYIDKKEYVNNLKNKIKEEKIKYNELKEKIKHDNVGHKLKEQEKIINQNLEKYHVELEETKKLENITYIASMYTITKYNEVVSFASGMDNSYRKFNPKYIMYPKMINDAIEDKLVFVNFLGVKNIFDINDSDYGVYEVKRGFGGKTIEYIGEFDLPINIILYYFYRLLRKVKKK